MKKYLKEKRMKISFLSQMNFIVFEAFQHRKTHFDSIKEFESKKTLIPDSVETLENEPSFTLFLTFISQIFLEFFSE